MYFCSLAALPTLGLYVSKLVRPQQEERTLQSQHPASSVSAGFSASHKSLLLFPGASGKSDMQTPNGTAFRTTLVPTIERGTALAPKS